MLTSVALAEAIERQLGLEPEIKWPNDLMIDDQKLAGVLAEGYTAPRQSYTLVGCGVNANQDAADLTPLGRPAISLKQAAGFPIHRGELLAICLERADWWLSLEQASQAGELRSAWEHRLWGLNQHLRFRDDGAEFEARVAGVDPDGSLVVQESSGRYRRIVSGEIVL
jgi:BirA family biotin operon repressor/biotin-[acetyl-CoA-carboxylase] ligase